MMISIVICFALGLSLLNWLLFVGLTLWVDLPDFRKIITEALKPSAPVVVAGGMGQTQTQAGVAAAQAVDVTKLANAAGSLAGAFKKAGAAPTAAAMSMICLILAAILAGVGKF